MGVLPLTFKLGDSAESLGLSGREQFTIHLAEPLTPQQEVTVSVRREDGSRTSFTAICRLDTPIEIDYYRHGGILPTVLRSLWREKDAATL
jgi:aconitate hydratase